MAGHALYAVTLSRHEGDGGQHRVVELAGPRPHEELLVRFLQDLIYLLDVESFVADMFTLTPRDDGGFTVEMRGHLCAPEHRETEVKAATYHGVNVRQSGGRWVADVVLDL